MRILHVATVVLASLIAASGTASASGANATLGVSVTVVRPCSVEARPNGNNAASVRLSCAAATRGSQILVGSGQADGRLTAPNGEVQVTKTPASPGADAGVRVVTLNF